MTTNLPSTEVLVALVASEVVKVRDSRLRTAELGRETGKRSNGSYPFAMAMVGKGKETVGNTGSIQVEIKGRDEKVLVGEDGFASRNGCVKRVVHNN